MLPRSYHKYVGGYILIVIGPETKLWHNSK